MPERADAPLCERRADPNQTNLVRRSERLIVHYTKEWPPSVRPSS